MARIGIISDSTAMLSIEEIEKYDIHILPLTILFKDEEFVDNIDLTVEQFYQKLEESDVLPTTSQPSVGLTMLTYEDLLKDYDEIIYITLASTISGTYQTAMMVKNDMENNNIHVIDSKTSSAVHKHLVITARKFAEQGLTATEVVDRIERIKETHSTYVTVDDLMALRAGGRLSDSAAILGTALKIKPIIHFNEDGLVPIEKVRTIKKAHLNLIAKIKKANLDETKANAFIVHCNDFENAEKIKEKVLEIYPNLSIEISEFTPVIGTHIGNGSIGLGWYADGKGE